MSKSRQSWCQEHQQDIYVQQAAQAGYRSRAVYKLAQIDERDHLFRPGMTVVDLGAAPGGWSQWVRQRLNHQVQLIAVDSSPMAPLPGVTFIQGDFREQTTLDTLLHCLAGRKVDMILSDMSPAMSGIKVVDQSRAMLLAELARDFAVEVLAQQGHFLTKLFQGEGFDNYVKEIKSLFKQVVIRKPEASRSRSAEVYLLAKYYVM
jgi:23S rRNA (uridine2552-2'-O)-methyltransferase